MTRPRLAAFLLKEVKEVVPPMLFFAIGFNLIVLTTQLVLDDYLVRFGNFMAATVGALVVGKAVLVANLLPFLRRFDAAPLIRPVLFKTVVYWAIVLVVRVVERLVEYWYGGGTLRDIPSYLGEHFSWHRFVAVQIWVFVLFLIYTSAVELNALIGDGGLYGVFFTRRTRAPRPTRR